MSRVLVVDDEVQLARALEINLRARGYDVDAAPTGAAALDLARNRSPDAVLLDLGLPDVDGIEVIKLLRTWSTVPIIVVSVRDAERDKVAALEAGADDYVTKPFGMDELLARLRSALRRREELAPTSVVVTRDFAVDLCAGTARRKDGDVHLTPTEWKLLRELMTNPGRLVPQEALLACIPPSEGAPSPVDLRRHLAHLRQKLEPDPSRPQYFFSEGELGYRFEAPS